jgi:hypothetical protein
VLTEARVRGNSARARASEHHRRTASRPPALLYTLDTTPVSPRSRTRAGARSIGFTEHQAIQNEAPPAHRRLHEGKARPDQSRRTPPPHGQPTNRTLVHARYPPALDPSKPPPPPRDTRARSRHRTPSHSKRYCPHTGVHRRVHEGEAGPCQAFEHHRYTADSCTRHRAGVPADPPRRPRDATARFVRRTPSHSGRSTGRTPMPSVANVRESRAVPRPPNTTATRPAEHPHSCTGQLAPRHQTRSTLPSHPRATTARRR